MLSYRYVALSFVLMLASVIYFTPTQRASAWTTEPTTNCGITWGDTQKAALQTANAKFNFNSNTDSWILAKINSSDVRLWYHPTQTLNIEHQGGGDYQVRTRSGGIRADTGASFTPVYYSDPHGGTTANLQCVQSSDNITYDSGYPFAPFPTETPPPPPPVDECANIEGNQSTVPEGMVKDSNGNCATPPPDPDPEPEPDPLAVLTFEQKMGIGLAFIAGGFVINQFRYRGTE